MNLLLLINSLFNRRHFLAALVPLDTINNKTVLSKEPVGMVTSCYFDFETNGWRPFEHQYI